MTGKKKFLTLATTLIASVSLGVAVVTITGVNNSSKLLDTFRAGADNKTVTINSAIFGLSGLTGSYQQGVQQDFGNERGVLNYALAKKDSSGNLVLAPSGRIFNYSTSATYKGRVTDIHSVKVTYTGGKLFIQAGIGGQAETYDKKIEMTSGTAVEFTSSPNFFMISNSEAETTITQIEIVYSCTEVGYSVERFGEMYVGGASDGNTYTFTRNGSAISGIGQTGTISVTNEGVVTMSIMGGAIVYTGTVSEDYKVVSITDKSGAGAESAPNLDYLYRVYVMDDFENYASSGTGFTNQASVFTASDLRANYFVDIGGGTGASSNATWIKNSGFKVANNESNYLNVVTNVKHSGAQSISLMNNGSYWSRMWSIDTFNQTQHFNFGSGNRLTFWTHGAYTDATCETASEKTVKIRAQVYYQNFDITDSNRNSSTYGTGTKDFTVNAGSDWTERVIPLDPSKKVMAINIMINNDGIGSGNTIYLPIDDISVYTVAKYQPRKTYDESATAITKSYNGKVTDSLGIKMELGADGSGRGWAGNNFTVTSYAISGNQITLNIDGSYNSKTFGTWTGTLSNSNNTITITKDGISGTIKDFVTNDIVLNQDMIVEDGSSSTATMQAKFVKQFQEWDSENNKWKWTTDSSSADRVAQDTEHYMQGNSSMAIGPKTVAAGAGTRITFNPSIAEAQGISFEALGFWIYKPANIALTYEIWSYDGYDPATATGAQKTVQTPDDGWTYINVGMGKGSKNFMIKFNNNTTYTYYIDYLTIY